MEDILSNILETLSEELVIALAGAAVSVKKWNFTLIACNKFNIKISYFIRVIFSPWFRRE
jgi:hypothetical protein